MTTPVPGRRERKKAQTRELIATTAREMFLAHGYDAVSVKEIADAADVAVTTVFKHFPRKETLVFDEEGELDRAMIAAVLERRPGQSILEALRDYWLTSWGMTHAHHPEFQAFVRLVETTPELRAYAERMWMRHEDSLASALSEATGAKPGDLCPRLLANIVLRSRDLIRNEPDPRAALIQTFDLLAKGFGDYGRGY